MIIGTRPCCGAPSLVEIGPAPCWERIVCDGCGAALWLRHSRIDPEMLTEDEFLKHYEVCGRTIKRRQAVGAQG